MPGDRSKDPALLLLGALADEIADRLIDRLAPQLAEIVEAGGRDLHQEARHRSERAPANETENMSFSGNRLWTAGRVAAHYGVAVRFIYQHAEELGCVRLGGGTRARLRFDPDVVRDRWACVGALPESASNRPASSKRQAQRRRSERPSFELLEFEREP